MNRPFGILFDAASGDVAPIYPSMTPTSCLFCDRPQVRALVDFGLQPLTNRWPVSAEESADEPEFRFRLAMGQCAGCGVVQLLGPPPPGEVRSRYDWLSYNEPEGHLDDVVQKMLKLPSIGPQSVVAGTSYKEDTTLARLNRRGLERTWRVDLARDLGETDAAAGLETVQERLTAEVAERLGAQRGAADLVMARHIIEHAHHPRSFAAALKRLVKPGGYVVFEVPDCTRSFDRGDFSMPWEEHVAYFTPETYRSGLECLGFEVLSIERYEYSHEDSLVAFCRSGGTTVVAPPAPSADELSRADRYAAMLPEAKAAYRAYFTTFRRNHGPIAALGAGHLCAGFLNLLELGDLVDFVVDDNPKKQGLRMPGSRLPIVPSSTLVERGVGLCLLSVNPEVERRVREKNAAFTARGGRWMSMFSGRPQLSEP